MKRLLSFSYAALVLILLNACTPEAEGDRAGEYETALRGTAEILCDEQIMGLMAPVKELYDSVHPEAHVTLKAVSGYDAVIELMAHRTRGIVLAREWLPQEDTIIREKEGADGFPRTLIAKDALVFFASKDFPIDTLNSEDIKAWLSGGTVDMRVYPALKQKPVFLVPGPTSSIYANITNVVNKGLEPPKGSVSSLSSMDSVKMAVRSDPTLIGVGYLSQFANDSSVKMLRLSFIDKDGQYRRPKPVHAAYLIQGLYPFPVPIYIVLRDRVNNYSLPSGFMLYVARDAKAQRKINDAGIEAGYARYELNLSE